MKFKTEKMPKMEFRTGTERLSMAAVYPGLYCPRCGSTEIGLKRLAGENAIWGCRDCSADFRLEFPKNSRF
jgi:ribosomal protein L37AE/L43A